MEPAVSSRTFHSFPPLKLSCYRRPYRREGRNEPVQSRLHRRNHVPRCFNCSSWSCPNFSHNHTRSASSPTSPAKADFAYISPPSVLHRRVHAKEATHVSTPSLPLLSGDSETLLVPNSLDAATNASGIFYSCACFSPSCGDSLSLTMSLFKIV